jgi:hypothetical protein
MSRAPTKKPGAESAAPPEMHSWAIYRLKSTPAALLGYLEAPDEKSAIRKAILEFGITNPQTAKKLLARRR